MNDEQLVRLIELQARAMDDQFRLLIQLLSEMGEVLESTADAMGQIAESQKNLVDKFM